jgi:hypothetical protein
MIHLVKADTGTMTAPRVAGRPAERSRRAVPYCACTAAVTAFSVLRFSFPEN